ncbi:hypothetical protein N8669_00950 [bacterium]|nr:hypothetical protein [bacterium]
MALLQFAIVVLGLLQTVIVAHLFGTTRQIEIFMAAVTLNTLALRLFQSGQIYEVFLPIYITVKKSDGADAANKLSSVLINWMLICFLAIFCILFVSAPFIVDLIASGFAEVEKYQATLMFWSLLPVLGIQLFSGILLMLGNAEKKFSNFQKPVIVSILLSILILVFFRDYFGAWVMVIALWTSQLTTLLLRLTILKKIGFQYSLSLQSNHLPIKKFFKKILVTVPSTIATTFFETVFTRELTKLSQGNFAIVTYARQILSKVRGLMVRPTSIVFFTAISETSIDATLKTKKLVSKALEQILCLITITSIVSWCALPHLIFSLYHSEDFSLDKIIQLSTLVSFLLLALLFDGLGVIYQKYNVSSGRITQQYIGMALAKFATTLMAMIMIPSFGFTGVIMTLFAQAVLYTVSGIASIDQRQQRFFVLYSLSSVAKWVVIFGGVWTLYSQIGFTKVLRLSDETSKIQSITCAVMVSAIVLIVSLGLGAIFKIEGVREILSSVMQRRKGQGDGV